VESEFQPESIGYLTKPVDVPGWVRAVRERYVFLRSMDEFEIRVSRCSRADAWEVEQAILALGGDAAVGT